MRKFLKYLTPFVIILTFSTGCASLKNSKIDKFYQNLTAHYNIYFNAYQSYLKVVAQTESDFKDEYTNILPVLKFPDEAAGKSNSSNVDFILTKCSKIIEKKKLSNWIDDSYLLIAKAYFYRTDYLSALETFQYIEDEYPQTNIAREAQVWMAKCMYQQKKYNEAKAYITLIKSKTQFPRQILKELLLTEAMVNIKTENYLAASNNLKEAIKYERKKTSKSRYLFIIAQLNQKTGNLNEAVAYYEKVIKRNPPYEMAFHSKIEISHCYKITDERSARPIRNMLEKMLLDDKNIQYYDQIYLELGLLELKLNNTVKAEDYFKLSIKYNQSNENLKGVAYMKLAEYYFANQNYRQAKYYYDSTMLNLNENYPDYSIISARNKVLADLVKYIITAEAEDSLQYLAGISPRSRDSIINIAYENELKQIREKEKAEQERKMAEEQEMRMSRQMMQSRQQGFMQPPGMGDNTIGGAKWYFYNQSAMTLGKSEFMVKWGKRKLEDNWRISQKNTDFSAEEGEETAKEEQIEDIVAVLTETEKKQVDSFLKNIPKEKQKYYADIPFTPAQMEASRKREIEALKRSGDIFLENLKDTANAIKSYERLLKKYPDNKYAAFLHYTLYLIYTNPADADKKSAHKESLLRDFPNSDFIILLENPDFFKEKIIEKNRQIEELYYQTYTFYLNHDCKKVQENNEISKTKYPGHPLRANFEYLNIVCNARNMKKDELIKSLTDFQNKFKNSKLNDEVANLLAYLNNEIVVTGDNNKKNEEKSSGSTAVRQDFILNDKAPHYFVYAFESRKFNSNEIKTAFSDYNAKYFSLANLEINSIMLNNDIQLIIVREFPDKTKAFEYLAGIKSDETFLTKIKNRNPQLFIILQENLTEVVKKQEYRTYFDFYTKNYFSN